MVDAKRSCRSRSTCLQVVLWCVVVSSTVTAEHVENTPIHTIEYVPAAAETVENAFDDMHSLVQELETCQSAMLKIIEITEAMLVDELERVAKNKSSQRIDERMMELDTVLNRAALWFEAIEAVVVDNSRFDFERTFPEEASKHLWAAAAKAVIVEKTKLATDKAFLKLIEDALRDDVDTCGSSFPWLGVVITFVKCDLDSLLASILTIASGLVLGICFAPQIYKQLARCCNKPKKEV